MAVENRCAVHFPDLRLPISEQSAVTLLSKLGITETPVDIIELARSCIGRSTYQLGAGLHKAPGIVDCSSFTKWLYAQKGIWIPRLSVQQYAEGADGKGDDESPGDLVFTLGRQNLYQPGHVGIRTGEGTVIQASFEERGVVETGYESFVAKGCNGIRRIIPANGLRTFTSQKRKIECSDDFRWLILKNLD
jgi:cell wall-associated NlpC family hydrolase